MEYDVDRKYIPQTIEFRLNAMWKKLDMMKINYKEVLALYPIIADKMDSLFVAVIIISS